MTDSTPIYASTNRRRYAQKPSHRTPFMRRYSYTESLVHREIFTHRCLHTHHRGFYEKKCTETVTHRCFARRCFCLRPENRPSVFAFFCVVICWVGWGGGGVITSCVYVIIDFLRWIRFMLRCTFLLYFGDQTSCYVAHLLLYIGEHTSCYVAHFCCASMNTLHVAKRKTIQKT